MAATRLPGKPLADIEGIPMIVRVLRQAQAAGIGPVAVAAGDAEIVEAVRAAGGQAILTDPDLPSGSDRIVAALQALDPAGEHDVVINLQGDIPFLAPSVVEATARLLADQPSCDISTVMVAESDVAERSNPDIPKVVASMQPDGRSARALYFTRSVLYGDAPVWLHHGVYGYRREALMRFTAAPPSPLELRERLEQLRALELGMSIWAAVIDEAPISVDNPADLERARAFARKNNE
ncbi:3-deoxy-manno-octulosonate cytidylyltransferase (CMP-KDO synthetase) [Phenylobacterium koreense]|uniref:3-deoxy-manno-octulosonate cytidylyltransferase (CMP-KDO synthetase) n=2 Tax=Caulobacteraceae TaxID=76892 RepID=A0ABV2EHW1_9CAUL